MGLDADSAKGNMVWKDYEPKPWEETDVDIKITNSGICGSDLHTLRSGWVVDHPLPIASTAMDTERLQCNVFVDKVAVRC